MTRLLGIIIANGLSSENRVFASLLSERHDRYDAQVLMHQADGDGTAHRFAQLSGNPTTAYDTGWRPSPYVRRLNPLRLRMAVRYVRHLEVLLADARGFAPDVVYSSQQHFDCRAASRVAQQTGAAQVVHLHYTVGPWLRRPVLERLKSAELVVTVSDFVRDMAIEHGVDPERAVTIHNARAPLSPTDTDRAKRLRAELGIPADAFAFGMVSRIDEGKGHLDAIEAFERVAAKRCDTRLVIVGSGRISRQVSRRTAASPVSDRIIRTGFRTDVDDLLGIFDALVHPARQDPCPLAVLEAMAAGLPIVGYADGGVVELVDHGLTGLLVRTGDVGELADALHKLQSEPSTVRALGSAGRQRLTQQFTPARAGAQFSELVTTLR